MFVQLVIAAISTAPSLSSKLWPFTDTAALPVAPGFFFDTVGGFGPRNGHYVFDTAAFELPLGLLYLAAIRWPSWRVPVLAFATAHYVMHAISHLIDVNTANIHWVGVFDFVVIVVGLVIHALALWFSVQLRQSD